MERHYHTTAPWLPAPPPGTAAPAEIERTASGRAASLTADLLVPLLQSAVTGALLGGLFVVLVFEVSPSLDLSRWKLWAWAALPITAVAWLVLLRQTRLLLWGAEILSQRDLDSDGAIGKPDTRILQVHVRHGSRTQIVYSDILGLDEDQLIRFAEAVSRGRKLSPESVWGKDKSIFPHGINDWRKTRAKLLEAGLVEKGSRGFQWTASGRAFVRRIVEYASDGRADQAPEWISDPRFTDPAHTHAHERFLACDTGER